MEKHIDDRMQHDFATLSSSRLLSFLAVPGRTQSYIERFWKRPVYAISDLENI
jgi:hypothetical protein